jgi:hypothetical protein
MNQPQGNIGQFSPCVIAKWYDAAMEKNPVEIMIS